YIIAEVRGHWWQIETATADVRMGMSDLHRQAALCRANVDNGLVILPIELRRERLRNRQRPSRHSLDQSFKRCLVGVQSGVMARRSCSTLRFPGSQRRRQQVPVGVYVGIEVIELPADIGRLLAVEIEIGLQRVGVTTAFISFEHAERDERAEKVAGAGFADANSLPERVEVERALGECGEYAKLDRAQQRLGCP